MAKAEELWAGSAWEEDTEWPLALMLRDGESGLGVEDDDDPKRNPEKRIYFLGLRNPGLNPAGILTVESSGGPYAVQSILETRKHNLMNNTLMTF